jgi:hypothetical protein
MDLAYRLIFLLIPEIRLAEQLQNYIATVKNATFAAAIPQH